MALQRLSTSSYSSMQYLVASWLLKNHSTICCFCASYELMAKSHQEHGILARESRKVIRPCSNDICMTATECWIRIIKLYTGKLHCGVALSFARYRLCLGRQMNAQDSDDILRPSWVTLIKANDQPLAVYKPIHDWALWVLRCPMTSYIATLSRIKGLKPINHRKPIGT